MRSIALSQAYSREGMGDTVPFAAAEGWAERVLAPADLRHGASVYNRVFVGVSLLFVVSLPLVFLLKRGHATEEMEIIAE